MQGIPPVIDNHLAGIQHIAPVFLLPGVYGIHYHTAFRRIEPGRHGTYLQVLVRTFELQKNGKFSGIYDLDRICFDHPLADLSKLQFPVAQPKRTHHDRMGIFQSEFFLVHNTPYPQNEWFRES